MLELHIDGLIFARNRHGGISRCFVNLLSALQSRPDVRIKLYLPGPPDQYPGAASDMDIITVQNPIQLRPSRLFLHLNRELRRRWTDRLWRKPRTGVFHSTYYSTHRSLRIPQVLTIQDMIYEIFPFDERMHNEHIEDKRRCVENATGIVCPSRATHDDARKHYVLENKTIDVIPYAVDPSFRPIYDVPRLEAFRNASTCGNPFILHVGARFAHKNFMGLLAAYSRWHGRHSFRLLAAGGGPIQPLELSAVRGMGIEDLVHFLSYVTNDELVTAYNAAAALIMPSLYEGFGFPVLEAMACGTPVAASKVASLPEVGGQTPIYFCPQKGDEIVAALDEAVRIPRDSERITQGIKNATQRTWADVAEDYVRIYRSTSTPDN